MKTIVGQIIGMLLLGGVALAPQARAAAGAPLWTNYYNGPGNSFDVATAVESAPNGNVIVAGNSVGTGGLSPDYAIIAYSPAGVPLWTNRYTGTGNGSDEVADIAVAFDGRIFVTGKSEGLPAGDDYATIAYSSTGQTLWTNRFNRGIISTDRATSVACDTNGNVSRSYYFLSIQQLSTPNNKRNNTTLGTRSSKYLLLIITIYFSTIRIRT